MDDNSCSLIGRITIVKRPYYPKQYTDSDPIKPYQNSNGIF